MNIMLSLVAWVLFFAVSVLAVFANQISMQLKLVITLLAAPVAMVIYGFIFYRMLSRYEKLKNIGMATFLAYLFAVPLGSVFLYLNALPRLVQLAYTVIVGFIAVLHSMAQYRHSQRVWEQRRIDEGYPDIAKASVEDWIFRGVWGIFVIVIVVAYFDGHLSNPVVAASILLFGSLTLYFTLYTATLILNGHSLSMESHWGGLGGGMGGWRVSRPLVFLILTILFGGLTAAIVNKAGVLPSMVSPNIHASKPEGDGKKAQVEKTVDKAVVNATTTKQTKPVKKTK